MSREGVRARIPIHRPTPLYVRGAPERDHVRVFPVGELDIAATPLLDQTVRELRDSGFDYLIVDLRRLSFIDSSGLRLLLELNNAANADSHRLELVAGPPEVQKVFEVSGVLTALPFRNGDGDGHGG
jgi:anti-sigma B factor antagonist